MEKILIKVMGTIVLLKKLSKYNSWSMYICFKIKMYKSNASINITENNSINVTEKKNTSS